jgi:hypothetical protein
MIYIKPSSNAGDMFLESSMFCEPSLFELNIYGINEDTGEYGHDKPK